MEIINVVIASSLTVLGLVLAWWMAHSIRIRNRLAEAEPEVNFSAGSYGGAGGWGVGVSLENKGSARAYNIVLEIPRTDSSAQSIDDLEPGATSHQQIPFPLNSPARKQPANGLQLRVVYHDRFGREFASSLDLESQERADGDYNLSPKPNQRPQTVRPPSGFWERWRLRNEI